MGLSPSLSRRASSQAGQSTNPYARSPQTTQSPGFGLQTEGNVAIDMSGGQVTQGGTPTQVAHDGSGTYKPIDSYTPSGGVGDYGYGGLEGLKNWQRDGGQITPGALIHSMPEYQSILNPYGQLKQGYDYKPEMINYGGMKSYDQFRDFATSKGPSEYYDQQANLIDQNTSASLDGIRGDQARNTAQGMSSLASSGGLSGGARERMSMNSNLAGMQAGQSVYRDAAMGKTQAGIADYQNRMGALTNLTQMDTTKRNMNVNAKNVGKMWNIDNKQKDMRQNNMYDLEAWSKIGDITGSGASADAMGGGSEKSWWEKLTGG